MTKPVSQALLKAVGETPLLTNILEMAGDLDHAEIAKLSRVFRSTIQKLQARVCSHLSLAGSVNVLGKDAHGGRSCAEDFQQAWQELEKVALQLKERNALAGAAISNNGRVNYEKHWNKMVQLKRFIDQEPAPAVKEVRMKRWLPHLQSFQKQITALDQFYSDPIGVVRDRFFKTAYSKPSQDVLPDLLEAMRQCILHESITFRFRAIVTQNPLSFNAQLSELHKQQKIEASANPKELARFTEIAKSHTFSVPRFIEQEKVAIRSEMARHSDISLLWEATLREFNRLGIALDPASMPKTPEEILRWFANKENEVPLARVELLACRGINGIPKELEKFSNLQQLSLHGDHNGKISTLPEWFQRWLPRLAHLQELSFDKNLLTEIPAALRELKVKHLSLHFNRITEMPLFLADLRDTTVNLTYNPIRVFPDEIYRAHEPFLGRGDNGIKVDTWKLEKIPFRLWFKMSLTPFPYVGVIYPSEHLDGVGIASPWYELLYCGFMCLNLGLLLNPLIFLYNTIQINIVEPLLTLCRDLLGFSRMVDVKPRI